MEINVISTWHLQRLINLYLPEWRTILIESLNGKQLRRERCREEETIHRGNREEILFTDKRIRDMDGKQFVPIISLCSLKWHLYNYVAS